MTRFYAVITALLMSVVPLQAQVYEPKEIKGNANLKADEGIVRLSLRTQRQFIETAYIYFIEVLPVQNVSQLHYAIPSFYSKDVREIGSLIANTDLFICSI